MLIGELNDEQLTDPAFPDLLFKANGVFEGIACTTEQAAYAEDAKRKQKKVRAQDEMW